MIFFFQAEDGIRDVAVTGVQTCALPILPYRPRRRTKELTRLLGEHARRAGDPNRGGVTRTPIVTAYRQEALRCALLIRQGGRANIKMLRETGVVPNVSSILQRDVYGWFRRRERATYQLTRSAQQDIHRFAAARTPPRLGAGPREQELTHGEAQKGRRGGGGR